jgi:hypothetical protein
VFSRQCASLELIPAGASINTIDSTGSTALHFAIKSRLPLTISKLLSNGALVNIKDNTGTTPLYHALEFSSFQGITALSYAGANPLDLAPDGRTPLHFLATRFTRHSVQDPKDGELEYQDEFAEYKKLYARCIEAGYSCEARDNAGNRSFSMGMFSCHFPFPSLDPSSCCFTLSYRVSKHKPTVSIPEHRMSTR